MIFIFFLLYQKLFDVVFSITFTNPFFEVPALGIAAQNMATGDTFTISSKTVNGFTIAFVNSSGAAVDRTFDYIAKGFGLQS